MAASVKRAMVVGGTKGIGYAIACRVAGLAQSATVTIVGRTQPKQTPHDNINFRSVDCTSMDGIKKFAAEYKAESAGGSLDLLVLTQGILTLAGRTETPEGIDRKMALHYYGRQLFIRELTPVLSQDAKVLIVLDSVNSDPSKLIWDDLGLKQNYSLKNAANHCLTMNDAMVQVLAATANSGEGSSTRHFVHAYPGFVNTSVPRDLPWYMRYPAKGIANVVGKTPAVCAEHLLDGTYAVAAAGEKENRFWSYIDNSGKTVQKKKTWTEEEKEKIVKHTWETIDYQG